MVPVAAFIFYMGGWMVAGFAAIAWFLPVAHASLPLVPIKAVGPMYSRAVARMKMGKYEDAEWEVLHELEKSEDDVQGWMMLAELYAIHFGDLAGAQRTIHEILRYMARKDFMLVMIVSTVCVVDDGTHSVVHRVIVAADRTSVLRRP